MLQLTDVLRPVKAGFDPKGFHKFPVHIVDDVAVDVEFGPFGTVTDVDGNFTLSVPSGAKLTVSYVGFESSTFVVSAGKDRYDIVLQEKNKSLDEVVVVGYGTQKKVNLTGSVASVSSDKLANRTGSDVTSMLTGLMPGVTVIQNTSLPGSDQGIMRVRGLGTMGNASGDGSC